MDKELFDENLLLLFRLLKSRKLQKSKCKKIYIRRRPPKCWVQNTFNDNLRQNLRFLQHSSRHYLHVRSSHQRCYVKIGVLRNFTKFTGRHLCQSLFLNKVSGLRLATLFIKRLWHKCFPVNFVKFLRTPFYTERLWWLLFPHLSLYILLLPCPTTLEILLLSQKVVLPPLCCEVIWNIRFSSLFTFLYFLLFSLFCIVF